MNAFVLLLLLAICSIGPGFFVVRRLRWSPMEKLCGAIGLSLVFVYLAAWAIYCSGVQNQRAAFWICAGIAVLLTIASARDLIALSRSRRVRRSVAGFAFLLLWDFVVLAMIRSYSGAGWYLDWLEHFQRALFFLHRFPAETIIGNVYALPARPPMMNVLATFFLGLTTDSFPLFQIAFVFLNALLFLACALILPALGAARRRTTLPLVALFAFDPMIVENTTYSWTKLFTSFYVILGVALFLAARRKGERTRMIAAFLALAAAALVHYSAGPYVVILTLFYLIAVFPRRPRKWQELAAIAISCALLLGTWFVWSAKTYGLGPTLTSNTTVSESENRHGGNIAKTVQNLITSIVPLGIAQPFGPALRSDGIGEVRDKAFLLYQANVIFNMGIAGGLIAVFLFFFRTRSLRGRSGANDRNFWAVFIPACVVLGIFVSSAPNRYGLAHETLLTISALGITWLAAWFPIRRAVAFALIAGCIVDFSLGVFLNARMQAIENGDGRTTFTASPSEESGIAPDPSQPATFSRGAWANWRLKHRYELDRRFLAEPLSPRVRLLLENDLSDDASSWQGWWGRHDWKIRFVGDEVAGSVGPTVPQALLLALAAALFALMIRAALRIPARAARSRARAPRKRR